MFKTVIEINLNETIAINSHVKLKAMWLAPLPRNLVVPSNGNSGSSFTKTMQILLTNLDYEIDLFLISIT